MTTLRQIIIAALLVIASTGVTFAQDAPGLDRFAEDDVREVQLLLSGYHDLAEPGAFARIDRAPQIVEAFARGEHGFVRDRALAALGRYWPSADVFLLYATVLSSPDTPEGTRHRVMLLFADAFDDRALPAVRPFLANENPRLQLTAVQALARIGNDEALTLIDHYADSITDPARLKQVEKYARTLR